MTVSMGLIITPLGGGYNMYDLDNSINIQHIDCYFWVISPLYG